LTDKIYSQYRKIEIRISAELKKHYEDRYPDRLDWINSYTIDDLVVPELNLEKTHENDTRFNGNLFLLTNKSTFSAAATFAGIFKELSLGTIIGEETGGIISYYGDFWFMKTPNTGIMFHVSPKRFIQYGGTEYDKGVIPDYKIDDEGDSIIFYTYDLIKRQLK
jgi:C-terminal processing protease CtpA/Prc